jgi:hypothetical protein
LTSTDVDSPAQLLFFFQKSCHIEFRIERDLATEQAHGLLRIFLAEFFQQVQTRQLNRMHPFQTIFDAQYFTKYFF